MSYINDKKYYVYRTTGEGEDDICIEFKTKGEKVLIPISLFDSLVVMRAPQLAEGMALEKVQKKTWKLYNYETGCDALSKVLGKRTAQEMFALDVARVARKKYVPNLGGVKKKKDVL